MKAAKIDPRFTIVLPWEHPGFEDYLERYFLTHRFLPARFHHREVRERRYFLEQDRAIRPPDGVESEKRRRGDAWV